MASKPLRPCKHPGCPELTREGWCPKHRPKHQRRDSEAYHGWYLLDIWTKRLRPEQLGREPFCRECSRKYPPGDPRHRTRATEVDHIRPFRGDWMLFVDPQNHQSLCKSCHDRKTAAEQAEERRKNGPISGGFWAGKLRPHAGTQAQAWASARPCAQGARRARGPSPRLEKF